MAAKIRFTGYLHQPERAHVAEINGATRTACLEGVERLVLCLVGGGQDGALERLDPSRHGMPPSAIPLARPVNRITAHGETGTAHATQYWPPKLYKSNYHRNCAATPPLALPIAPRFRYPVLSAGCAVERPRDMLPNSCSSCW